MNIKPYLYYVYHQLKSYIDEGGDFRKLESLSFEGTDRIDYRDKQIQELYILRYSYAYAFEYKTMFSEILSRFDGAEELNVLSLGCGPLTDLWSLNAAHSSDDHGIDTENITYIGVDLIDWNNKDFNSIPIERSFVQRDIIDYIQKNDISGTDIVFFPKSICEIPTDRMEDLCEALSNGLKKDKIAVGVSLRNEYDETRIKQLIAAMKGSCYTASESICNEDYTIKDENGNTKSYQSIHRLDDDFTYPQLIIDYVTTLSEKVADRQDDEADELKDKLDRTPTLTTSKINYQIIIFEREQA